MAELQQNISKRFPEATFEDGEILLINIADSKLHDLVKSLRDEHGYDYLVTIVGFDRENALGCVYYLASTKTNGLVSVSAQTTDRDNPMLHSIADLYRVACLYEREVYDFYGIVFIGNPDMRRLFLNIDWVGYPLRKDYDTNSELNPVSIENERQTDNTYEWVETADGKIEKREHVIFGDEDFVVNIGPQHPATHGVLRFRTSVDGETIKKIDVYMGYIHRGVEKLCEDLTYMQTLHFMDRLDYFSAHNYHHGLCLCMTFNYDCIGGLIADLHEDFVKDVKELLAVIPKNIKEYNKLFTGNVIAKNRLTGVGVLSREDAISYGVTGPSGRASGWACDVRKTHPYSGYDKIDFKEIVRTEGDSMARFKNRIDEIEQSAHILEQLVDNIPEGEWLAKVPKVLKLPVGHWFQLVEGCRGVFGVYIESDGSTKPYRLKLVTPSLPAAGVVDHITRGQKIADLITIGGSLDYIVPDMDR